MCEQITIIKGDKCDRMCLYRMLALEKETLSLNWEIGERERCKEKVTSQRQNCTVIENAAAACGISLLRFKSRLHHLLPILGQVLSLPVSFFVK